VPRDERSRHRPRSIRFEVIVPFRVLPGGEVVSCSGYPLPVWPRSLQALDLAGISSSARARGCESSSFPLVRFDPPLRLVPETSVPGLSTRDNSHGISCPFSAYRQRESTSFRLTGRPPCLGPKASPGLYRQVPFCQLRCRSQAFSASQRPCSSRRHPALFRQVALMGLRPPGIFPSPEASDGSSLPEYPLDVAPAGCAAPVLGWSAFGHTTRS